MRNDEEHQLTPDLPPPVEAPELWHESQERKTQEEKGEERPPDPEHGGGDGTGTGEPPD